MLDKKPLDKKPLDREPDRPDPDALLAITTAQSRGKLKIFFGACAGVGKTCAMLQEARRLRAQGVDVIVGVAETHGRNETAALLDGLTLLPLKRLPVDHRQYKEFDVDAALARRPALILIDELAHSNIRGSRHPKRWQDVEALLEHGIDVFTTINVQHLESLNDVVGGITGVRIYETVPDFMFDEATEVVLVDLPPDDLRQRLSEGKIYIAGQAERAIEHFFRKGNLIALRELALRRTADRVDEQMCTFRKEKKLDRIWHTRDAMVLCIGHQNNNDKIVRAAARIAAKLGSIWYAVCVETPRLQRLPPAKRQAILQALRLAQELGAETAVLADVSEERAVLRYAREKNLATIVTGRRIEHGFRWRSDFTARLGKLSPDIDLIIVASENSPDSPASKEKHSRTGTVSLCGCAVAIGQCIPLTLLLLQAFSAVEAVTLLMIALLSGAGVALFYGLLPSVLASVINTISFTLFIGPPHSLAAVENVNYWITMGVMLTVNLVVACIITRLQYQARTARYHEQCARHLYEMSSGLNRALTVHDIAKMSLQFFSHNFHAKSALLLPQEDGQLHIIQVEHSKVLSVDSAIARWSFDTGIAAGAGTDTLAGLPYQLHPLRASRQTWGVLAIEPANLHQLMLPEQQHLLQGCMRLMTDALAMRHSARTEVTQKSIPV